MIGKIAIFAAGYVLGARAGRKRYQEIVDAARWIAGREELQAAVGMARSAAVMAFESQPGLARGRKIAS